jgi:hypothetical protein
MYNVIKSDNRFWEYDSQTLHSFIQCIFCFFWSMFALICSLICPTHVRIHPNHRPVVKMFGFVDCPYHLVVFVVGVGDCCCRCCDAPEAGVEALTVDFQDVVPLQPHKFRVVTAVKKIIECLFFQVPKSHTFLGRLLLARGSMVFFFCCRIFCLRLLNRFAVDCAVFVRICFFAVGLVWTG